MAELRKYEIEVALANSFGKKKHKLFNDKLDPLTPKPKANRKHLEELTERFK